jgi:hypothetical protein
VISSWGGRRTPPYALTEQGVALLSSVLHSKRTAQVNVEIMRTFVRLREPASGLFFRPPPRVPDNQSGKHGVHKRPDCFVPEGAPSEKG